MFMTIKRNRTSITLLTSMLAWMDHRPTTRNVTSEKRTNYSRSFLSAIRSLILVNGLIGLAPVTVFKIGKKYKVESSPSAEIYALLIFLVYAFNTVKTYLVHSKLRSDWVLLTYLYIRQVTSLLINITCLKNRQIMLKGFRDIEDLRFSLPKRWVVTPFMLIVGIISVSLFGKLEYFQSFVRAILECVPDALPCIVTICISSLYGCKVEAMRLAIAQLNKDISNLLEQPIKFDYPSIREIMRQYNRLRRICTTLNLAYGQQMFLATSYMFMELVMSTFFETFIHGLFSKLFVAAWALCQTIGPLTAIRVCQTTANEIREWEVQLQQQRIYFTAWSFFELDCGQIRTIISSIITYGIILLQNWKLKAL